MRSLFAPVGLALLIAQAPLASARQEERVPALSGTTRSIPVESSDLTLEMALRMAFDGNPGLRAVGRNIDIAAGQRVQAATRHNPTLSYLSERGRPDLRTTTIQIDQPIELGGKRGARIAAAESEQDVAAADVVGYRSDLRADVVAAFFEVLIAQERLSLAKASQELSEKATGAASRRVTAGKISPVEETRARVAEASTKIELSQATNELALARRRLAATWGSATVSFGQVVAPAAPATFPPAIAELLALLPASPQISRARREIDRQNAIAGVERSRRISDLTLSVGSKRDDQSGLRQTVLGLAVPLPLFDRNQGNLLSALRRADKARDELLAVENRVASELTQASLRLGAASAELNILRVDILPGAQSAYESAVKGFELGKFSFLDVLDAQRTLFQSKTQYVRALAQSHGAEADIERLLGTALPRRSTSPTP